MSNIHSFHIPVMGTAFTIDSPIKVAHYGISSVISLVDDTLLEEMRQYHTQLRGEEYIEITKHEDDYRARRTTEYLNLVDTIVKENFEKVRSSYFEIGSEITKYFEMLSERSPLKKLYKKMLVESSEELRTKTQEKLRSLMKAGSIDVNIMTKLDRVNYKKKVELPQEFSDALAALRGYAKSSLDSSIIFSAGINRRLYSYVEKFEDFYGNTAGELKKRIILKVSDYRSSLIQGRFFAKKGLWVSEYRIESGLNCGGHAFASDGFLMGPILDEFKRKKTELTQSLHEIYLKAVKTKEKYIPESPFKVFITAQGGIGTAQEDSFIREHYDLDGTGWGTPMLLCPEATNVDEPTMDKLLAATEKDLYLSPVSPLGVPFNNLRHSFSDDERDAHVAAGRPGSPCPKSYLVSNTEFTEIPICTASRQYQKLKLEQLEESELSSSDLEVAKQKVYQKSCICHDLSAAVVIKNNITKNGREIKRFTAICPGPNLAYFSRVNTLEEIVGHIYGSFDVGVRADRPNMFNKELELYITYFKNEILISGDTPNDKRIAYLNEFNQNMINGMDYYKELFSSLSDISDDYKNKILSELNSHRDSYNTLLDNHKNLFSA